MHSGEPPTPDPTGPRNVVSIARPSSKRALGVHFTDNAPAIGTETPSSQQSHSHSTRFRIVWDHITVYHRDNQTMSNDDWAVNLERNLRAVTDQSTLVFSLRKYRRETTARAGITFTNNDNV